MAADEVEVEVGDRLVRVWPCQPQLAPPFSFYVAPHSVVPGLEFSFDLAPALWGGLEAGGGFAGGWFASGRDAVERLAFGVAELVGDLAESVNELLSAVR